VACEVISVVTNHDLGDDVTIRKGFSLNKARFESAHETIAMPHPTNLALQMLMRCSDQCENEQW
jgi:hypothetical protein